MTTITLHGEDLDHFRYMLRDQLGADHELLHEIEEGYASRFSAGEVRARIAMVDRLAERVGLF
jgi:hypothetical protein